jgi:hypothetical protein
MAKLKIIKVYLDKKYLLAFRVAMILVALPFILNVYETLTSGVALDGKFTFIQGEHWGYYSYLSKNLAFSFLFLWLGLFGTEEKK